LLPRFFKLTVRHC